MDVNTTAEERELLLSRVLVTLYKGVFYRENDESLWSALLDLVGPVRDHFARIGVRPEIDESEGYAYLRYPREDEIPDEVKIPRLIARRQLTFDVSLMLALLRRRLAESDASGGGVRLVMSRGEIVDLVRHCYPDAANDAKLVDKISGSISKVEKMGFLKSIKASGDEYEVLRIIKAFVDAQWLNELDRKLAGYMGMIG